MSLKKRKWNNHIWYICDLCKAIVQVKDTQVHKDNSCPANEVSPAHPFIRNDALYVNIEPFIIEEISSLRSIPPGSKNGYILLPINALQLLKIPIGDPVIICPISNGSVIPFVKSAWVISEKKFTAYITKEAARTNALNFSDYVSIHPLNENVDAAKLIVVKCENDYELLNKPDVMVKVKMQNLNTIYCIGNKFTFSHFGKELTFKIMWLEPENSVMGETESKNDWMIKVDHRFFVVTEETIWKIEKINLQNTPTLSSYKMMGGLNETIQEIKNNISLILSDENVLPVAELHPAKGFLIFGPTGVGKTTLVEMIAQEYRMNLIRVESSQIFSKYFGEAEKQLHNYFEKAKEFSPSILLIDDLDTICPKINRKNDQEKRIVATISAFLDKIHLMDNLEILVFATTCRVNDIDKSLRRPGRFGKEFELHVPNASQRYEILKVHLKNINHNLKDSDIREISDLSHGFVGSDLISLISQAALRFFQRRSDRGEGVTANDFYWALSKVKPSAMKEVLIDIPNVKWDDIGGQDELKLKLRQAVEWPLIYNQSFKTLGIVPPRGLLMFGPPGCSKTMIAKALATESRMNFISVKGPELFSKWVGESEKAVREVFRRAKQVAPSIIFFDELDAIGGERNISSGGTNVEERVLAQLLTELDGVEPLGNVTIVGATNRLDRIDPALLRPGRFDRIIYVPLPDKETRRQIFDIQLRKTPVSSDVNLEELIANTEGYSGAEIVAVCHEAALKTLEEDFASQWVTRKNFLIALKIILPRTPPSLLQMYEKYINK